VAQAEVDRQLADTDPCSWRNEKNPAEPDDPLGHFVALNERGHVEQERGEGVQKYWKNLGPRVGASYRLTTRRWFARLRSEHVAVPRQQLRLQLSGEAEQRVQRPEQLCAGAPFDEHRVPDPVFVQIPSNGLVDASPAVLRNAGYFHVQAGHA